MASLSGWSRSGNKTCWDHYVADGFDSSVTYQCEETGSLMGTFETVNRGDSLRILSPELQVIDNRKFASVELSTGLTGLLAIKHIQKPRKNTSDKSVLGLNSKEFLPVKLNLAGIDYTNCQELISHTDKGLSEVYGDSKYDSIRAYLVDIMDAVLHSKNGVGTTYKNHNTLDKADINTLSKNFGEVIAAINILAHDKDVRLVRFPLEVNTQLYDLIVVKTDGSIKYVSVKSNGGSSTSLANLKFLINENNKNDSSLQSSLALLSPLMNDSASGKTTITCITNFFISQFPEKTNTIVKTLNSLSSTRYLLTSLTQSDLDNWFSTTIYYQSEQTFINTLNSIYTNILGDLSTPIKSTESTLKDIYNSKYSKDNGYLLYALGSYIKTYLNQTNSPYLKALSHILSYGEGLSQHTISLKSDRVEVKQENFQNKSFCFSYNGMSKAPANRPLGFIAH